MANVVMERLSAPQAGALRLLIGAGFGLGLAALSKIPHPVDELTPLVAILTPTLSLGAFITWASAGSMRRLSLGLWSALALGLIAMIYGWRSVHFSRFEVWFSPETAVMPLFLFVLHELVCAAEGSGRPLAPYRDYFDQSWKHGVQLVLAMLFAGLMWVILGLGATLLGFIGFKWLGNLLSNPWFAMPVSGLSLGAAVHLGDVRSQILTQIRTVILGVLGWLLPIMVLIGLLFSVSLLFSGLKPLWATKAAGLTLLSGSTLLILLINAAFQSGAPIATPPFILRWAIRIGSGLLVIFAGLAAFSLWLRVHQYGWTPSRIMAGIGTVLVILYAMGYGLNAVLTRRVPLEGVNIFIAHIFCGLGLWLLSPWGNPARLSVHDQVQRLEQGRVKVADFDWNLLGPSSGTFGKAARDRLSHSGRADILTHLQGLDPLDSKTPKPPPARPDLSTLALVGPTPLPPAFVSSDFSKALNVPPCLLDALKLSECRAMILDTDDDGVPEVLVLSGNELSLLRQDGKAYVWDQDNYLTDDQVKAFRNAQVTVAPRMVMDVKIGKATILTRTRGKPLNH